MLDQRPPRLRTRRPRRSSEELRRTILQEARRLFAENGYQGVSTRTIAAAAGASESLVFTNWGSKSGLFRAAVLEPFETFIEEYQRHWGHESRSPTLEHEARSYIVGMYDLLHQHKRLVLALIAAEAFDQEALEGRLTDIFEPLLDPIVRLVADECERRGWNVIDPVVITHAMFGMVTSMTVLGGLLHAEYDQQQRDHAIEQMTMYWVGAIRAAEPTSFSDTP